MKTFLLLFITITASFNINAQSLEITRAFDGDYSFKIYRTTLNEGSTLKKEAVLINDPTSPVKITNQSFEVEYEDRQFTWVGNTKISVSAEITGLKITHVVYDVFGQHVKSLANTEIKDFNVQEISLSGEWRAYDSEATSMLTHVSFISRVRYKDGSQWVYDERAVADEIANLNLEEIADIEDIE